VSIGELLLGIFTEKFVGIIYWDYSWIPFHMTRYTSLPTSLGFACIIYFFMNHCFTPIMNLLSLLPDALLGPIAVILFTITCADNLYCYWIMYRTHDLYCRWRIHLFRKSTNSPVLYQ
jgi:uncharacterized membrane protein